MWTNIVGAALWVANEYEREQKQGTLVTNKDRQLNYPPAQAPSTTSNEYTPLLQQQEVDA
jgi:hypothetical protein